jgi:hypothetical protein
VLLAGVLAGSCRLACAPTEEIILPAEATPARWITIEFGNPSCPAIGQSSRWRIVVPANGYACTSTPMYRDWRQQHFLAPDAKGRYVDVGDKVHQHHTIEGMSAQTKTGDRSCAPNAYFFWYGDAAKMAGDDAAAYRERHPECP